MSNSLLRRFWRPEKVLADAPALLVIVACFLLFFWPATLKGRLLVFSDSLVYSYPLRVVAFDAIRHGTLPLWTQALLSGYPLLSMAQLGIGYPLTWGYLLLPGYWAEQVYVLTPYLLAPAFTFAYLRAVGRSRAASLLGGLSFTYGGMMAGGIAHNGMFTNAVMWLPLMLIAIERARHGRWERCLLGVAGAYSMSVLTGIGQAFLYTGLIALSYALFLTFFFPPSDSDHKPECSSAKFRFSMRAVVRTLRPLMVCVGGMALAAGVAAFQILETLRAQRRSIRSELSYDIFSGGGFTLKQSFQAFFAPYHHLNWEATPTINLLAALFAMAAVIAALSAPSAYRRVVFWLGLAVLGGLLIMGDHTPLYRMAFHVPIVNRFRLPWRHTFEWSFAISVLAAFGFDAARNHLIRWQEVAGQRRAKLTCPMLVGGTIAVAIGWWMASGLRLAAGEALLKAGDSTQYISLSQSAWLWWKIGFAAIALLAVAKCLRPKATKWDGALLMTTIALACCLEGFMLVSVWWFPFAKPAGYFQLVSAPTQFLKSHAPETRSYRIYTSAADYSSLNLALADIHNLSAIHGFYNAAGYEPLMPEKYNRAFEGRWSFFTPWFGAPTDPQILSPRWQVLDLLNTRFLIEFSATKTKAIEKHHVLFADADITVALVPAASVTLTGSVFPVDSLSIVSSLANSTHLTQGQRVATIAVYTTDGRILNRELRAGLDTAEWAHERPDVKLNIKHGSASVFDSQPGDAENSFPANRYWARVDLGETVPVDRVEITNVAPGASLAISKLALYDSSTRGTVMLTRRLPDHWRKVYDQTNVQIYENQRAMSRAWLVPRAETVSSEEALRRIRGQSEQDFDPKSLALLEAPPDKLANLSASSRPLNGEANIIRYEPNRLVIGTKSDYQSVLVASEINYPGWEATVDGKQTEIYTADYLLRGIVLPAGEHRVEMRYTAPAARSGGIISALSLLMIVGLLLKVRASREARPQPIRT